MNKINLAIIDDDEMYVLAMKKLIDGVQLSERTVYFENGKLALNYLDQCIHQSHLLPELILLDLNMPEINGWQFIKEFRKLKTKIDKKVTIYMISNTVNEDEIHKAKGIEEITDFICKPVTMHALSKILNTIN